VLGNRVARHHQHLQVVRMEVSSSSSVPSGAMSSGTAAVEPMAELVHVVTDRLDLVSDALDLVELGFQMVDLSHDPLHSRAEPPRED